MLVCSMYWCYCMCDFNIKLSLVSECDITAGECWLVQTARQSFVLVRRTLTFDSCLAHTHMTFLFSGIVRGIGGGLPWMATGRGGKNGGDKGTSGISRLSGGGKIAVRLGCQ